MLEKRREPFLSLSCFPSPRKLFGRPAALIGGRIARKLLAQRFGICNGTRRARESSSDFGVDGGVELAGGNDDGHETGGKGFASIHCLGIEHDSPCPALTKTPDNERSDCRWDETKARFGEREFGGIGRDHDVADREKPDAAAIGWPLDARDQ